MTKLFTDQRILRIPVWVKIGLGIGSSGEELSVVEERLTTIFKIFFNYFVRKRQFFIFENAFSTSHFVLFNNNRRTFTFSITFFLRHWRTSLCLSLVLFVFYFGVQLNWLFIVKTSWVPLCILIWNLRRF